MKNYSDHDNLERLKETVDEAYRLWDKASWIQREMLANKADKYRKAIMNVVLKDQAEQEIQRHQRMLAVVLWLNGHWIEPRHGRPKGENNASETSTDTGGQISFNFNKTP